MCSKELLVGYLYGELSPAEKAACEAHIDQCVECRQELSEMRATRQHLAAWSPPESDSDFTIVQTARGAVAASRGRTRWTKTVPRWGLAAAATLIVLAGAAAIANLEVRVERDGSLVVRTGWSARPGGDVDPDAAAAALASRSPRSVDAASEQLRAQVVALQRRLQDVEESLEKSQPVQETRLASGRQPGISIPELRKVLAESEARQRAEMAAQITQLWKDWSVTRANDWVRIQQTMGQVHTLTNRQLQQQNDSIQYIRTVLHQNQR